MAKKSNLIYYTASQQSKEYARGQYFGAIDILREQEATTVGVNALRESVIKSYRQAVPQLFERVDNINAKLTEMTEISSEIRELVGRSVESLGRIEATLEDIHFTLDYGLRTLAYQQDITNSILTDISKTLSSPVATEAAEYLDRGMGLFRDGFHEEAEADLERVLDLDPTNHFAWYYLAVLRSENLGDYAGSIDALDKCERYASKRDHTCYSNALLQRALLLRRVDRNLTAALENTEKSIAADETNLQATFLAAELSAESGRNRKAEDLLQRCELADSIFYLRSASSAPLKSTGTHDKVYGEATARMVRCNALLDRPIRVGQQFVEELRKSDLRIDGVESFVDCMERLKGASDDKDYLAQRQLAHITSVMVPRANECADLVTSELVAKRRSLESNHHTSTRAAEQASSRYDGAGNAVGALAGLGLAVAIFYRYRDTITMLLTDLFVFDEHESGLDFFFDIVFMGIMTVPFLGIVGLAGLIVATVIKMPFSLAGKAASGLEKSGAKMRFSKDIRKFDAAQKKVESARDKFKESLSFVASAA